MLTNIFKNFGQFFGVKDKNNTAKQAVINTDLETSAITTIELNLENALDLRSDEEQYKAIKHSHNRTEDIVLQVFETPKPVLFSSAKKKTRSGPLKSNYLRSRNKERVQLH